MNVKTHLLGGSTFALGSFLIFAPNIEIQTTTEMIALIELVGCSKIGAKLADIDNKQSSITTDNKLLSFCIRLFTEHRGITHSPFFLAILTMTLMVFNLSYPNKYMDVATTGIIIGYLSHLVYDMLNTKGIPLLYPFIKTRFHIMNIKTDGLSEYVFRLINLGLYILMLICLFKAQKISLTHNSLMAYITSLKTHIQGLVLRINSYIENLI